MSLVGFLENQRAIIDAEIARVIPRDSPAQELYDAQQRFIDEGGKRWRPIVCMLVHQALGGDAERVLPFAAGMELVHNFSLIHDDIEDGDRSRRGRPTVWVLHGIPKAINIGDSLLNKAYECVARLREEGFSAEMTLVSLRMLCRSMILLSEGQAMEMDLRNRWDVTEAEYMEMVWRKTGILVSTAAAGGAYLAGAGDSVVQGMMDYGKLIGPAFQITDDVLNVAGEYGKYKKEIGGDIREGKKTLIVIHLLQHLSRRQRARVETILAKPRRRTTREDCRYVVDLMEKHGSIGYARGVAEQKLSEAKMKLMILPESAHRDRLGELTDFLVRRDF